MLKSRNLILAVVVAGAVAFAAFTIWSAKPAAPQVTFISLQGEKITTAGLRGKVVLVNFWATSCVSCVAEMPKLVETQRKYGPKGYSTLAVAMSYDHPNRVAEFTAKQGLPFRVALDTTGDAARRFGNVSVTPTTFLIDRRGRVVKHYLGEPDWPAFHALVEKALAEPA